MKIQEYQAIGVNIKVEIFDFDMREKIWPMSNDDNKGIWLPKETADRFTVDQIRKWFLNRYLIDYGNSNSLSGLVPRCLQRNFYLCMYERKRIYT